VNARNALRQRGWAVIPGVVDADELPALVDAFDACFGSEPLPPVAQQPGAGRRHVALGRWLQDGRLGALGAQLLGCRRVRVLQDVLIAKPAGGGEVPWHRDASYTGYLPAKSVVSLRLALGSESLPAGGLEVLDGSHLWPEPTPDLAGATEVVDGLATLRPAQRPLAEAARREVLLRPGDVSAHEPRTWHRSAPNAGERRRTVVVHVFDADARVDRSRIPRTHRQHLLLDADGRLRQTPLTPLIYPPGRSTPP